MVLTFDGIADPNTELAIELSHRGRLSMSQPCNFARWVLPETKPSETGGNITIHPSLAPSAIQDLMAKVQNPESAPLFKKELKSLEACFEIFRLDDDRYLAEAVYMAGNHIRRNGQVPLITVENATHECGLALWKAIGAFNEHRLVRGGPDYEVLGLRERLESDPWNNDEDDQGAEQNGLTTPRKIITRLRRSPTQHGKFRLLADQAGEIAEMIDELVAGIDLVHRMGMIGRATKSINVSDEKDRAKMRALLQEEKARLQQENGLRGIKHLLHRMSEHKAKGGAPGHVFQQEFVRPLIAYWHGLFGDPPARDDAPFLSFVEAAYAVFSAREFDGWESALRTSLKGYGKTDRGNLQGSD